jgi:predicted regulator of Ras-like GTPase activity (Roadblock/LC7/MglB family)
MSEKRCRIDIYEADGKLMIFADIPPDMEATLAGALAHALMEQANTVMNTLMDEKQPIEMISHQ